MAALAQSPYYTSKFAFEALSEGLAQEVAPFGVVKVATEPCAAPANFSMYDHVALTAVPTATGVVLPQPVAVKFNPPVTSYAQVRIRGGAGMCDVWGAGLQRPMCSGRIAAMRRTWVLRCNRRPPSTVFATWFAAVATPGRQRFSQRRRIGMVGANGWHPGQRKHSWGVAAVMQGVKDQAVEVKVWGELKHALVGLRPGAVVLVVTVRRGKSSTRLARRLELAVVV
jgi:hypothetical protein